MIKSKIRKIAFGAPLPSFLPSHTPNEVALALSDPEPPPPLVFRLLSEFEYLYSHDSLPISSETKLTPSSGVEYPEC